MTCNFLDEKVNIEGKYHLVTIQVHGMKCKMSAPKSPEPLHVILSRYLDDELEYLGMQK